jgi:hypothetical protein
MQRVAHGHRLKLHWRGHESRIDHGTSHVPPPCAEDWKYHCKKKAIPIVSATNHDTQVAETG